MEATKWVKIKMKLNSLLYQQHYDRKKLFVVFLILIAALTIDVAISDLAPAATVRGIVTFTMIAGVFVLGQFVILSMIKVKHNENKSKYYRQHRHNQQHQPNNERLAVVVDKTVTIIKSILVAVMMLIVIQILVVSYYYTNLLTISVSVSYGLAAFVLGLLAYRLFSWYMINKSLVILVYALAYCIVVVNAIDSLDAVLLGKPAMTVHHNHNHMSHFKEPSIPRSTMTILPVIQTQTLISYFVLTWAATIILLIHNASRLGKLKFWLLIVAPSGYFIIYYLFPVSTTITNSISSGIVTGVLIAISFWSISRSIPSQESHIRDYMILTAYCFIIFFTAGSATVLQAGYPPFGLANVSFVGLASYLILTGIYQSTVSVENIFNITRLVSLCIL